MTKRHQASRRRTYARRQHELNERASTLVPVMDWDTADDYLIEPEWLVKRLDALTVEYESQNLMDCLKFFYFCQ